jgi:hypothetical protein
MLPLVADYKRIQGYFMAMNAWQETQNYPYQSLTTLFVHATHSAGLFKRITNNINQ